MTINIISCDEREIERRLAEARQARRIVEWMGARILLSDLPEDQNDNELPTAKATCGNCQQEMWVFPTMLTSCQMCGCDWQDRLWELALESNRELSDFSIFTTNH